jgi:hypothetical protein
VTELMLTEAASFGYLECLTIWAEEGVRVTSAEPLIYAVYGNHLEVVRCLVQDLGADVNQATPHGWISLMIAAWKNHLAIVRCLVELVADVNQTMESDGRTSLIIAADIGGCCARSDRGRCKG